jgi:hypothetical protein
MLGLAGCFPLLAFGIPGFVQTSIFQARNRTTGAAMSLIKQSDVKNHLSPRFRTKIHLCQPESQPDATGFSGAEPVAINAIASSFTEDFVAEHSAPDAAAAPGGHLPGSFRPETETPKVSKSARA